MAPGERNRQFSGALGSVEFRRPFLGDGGERGAGSFEKVGLPRGEGLRKTDGLTRGSLGLPQAADSGVDLGQSLSGVYPGGGVGWGKGGRILAQGDRERLGLGQTSGVGTVRIQEQVDQPALRVERPSVVGAIAATGGEVGTAYERLRLGLAPAPLEKEGQVQLGTGWPAG